MELAENELGLRYQTFCDPRLNFEQSLDLAFLVSDHFKKQGSKKKGGRNDSDRGRPGLNTYASDAFAELVNNQK